MATSANWNYFEPIFSVIAFVVVVVYCAIVAIHTLHSFYSWDFARSNGMINCVVGLLCVWFFLPSLFCSFTDYRFIYAVIFLPLNFTRCLSCISLPPLIDPVYNLLEIVFIILLLTLLTLHSKFIGAFIIQSKIVNAFYLFASTAFLFHVSSNRNRPLVLRTQKQAGEIHNYYSSVSSPRLINSIITQ